MNIKGTMSEKNVMAAFAGESQARNRYTYFARQAREEGNLSAAELFEKMADNEKEHAKVWFKILNGDISDTASNLERAANGENMEWQSMYPAFAEKAREEGFEMLAAMFDRIGAIENDHARRFLEELIKSKNMDTNMDTKDDSSLNITLQQDNNVVKYCCVFCGNIEDSPLQTCSVCGATDSFEKI